MADRSRVVPCPRAPGPRSAELAYELLRRAHGHGYATEASAALVVAAAATGRRRLWCTVGTWNAASLGVLDKLGFKIDRVQQEPLRDDTVFLTRVLASGNSPLLQ